MTMRRRSFDDEAAIEAATDHLLRQFGPLDETQTPPEAATGGAGVATTPPPLTTKGDLHGFDTANARIPVGTNDQILIADSVQDLGVRWGAAPTAADTRVTTLMLGGM